MTERSSEIKTTFIFKELKFWVSRGKVCKDWARLLPNLYEYPLDSQKFKKHACGRWAGRVLFPARLPRGERPRRVAEGKTYSIRKLYFLGGGGGFAECAGGLSPQHRLGRSPKRYNKNRQRISYPMPKPSSLTTTKPKGCQKD